MPFTKHIIEPIDISQCPLPPGEPNELECLSNLTLANVIRQLSSLGQHAGRLFDELFQDALKTNSRISILNQRIQGLKSKCAQLDIQNEDVSVEDLKTKKQFKSSIKIDQQVVSRRTMPDSIKILYNQADPPPALDKLNPYRTDGKDCMKFYTDPDFFFSIWCNELINNGETRKNEKKRRKSRDKQTPKVVNNQQPVSQYAESGLNLAQKQLTYSDAHRPSFQQQQQQKIVDPNYQYQQQQLQLLHLKQQQQNIYAKNQQPQTGYYINEHEDDQGGGGGLPPPPPPLLNQNIEIYAETNHYNNGNRLTKLNIQQANMLNNKPQHYGPSMVGSERPHLPPPPIPSTDNHISDLQQIQQQIIRKFDGISLSNRNQSNDMDHHNNQSIPIDLPPPPSPLNFAEPGSSNNNNNNNTTSSNNTNNGGALMHPKMGLNAQHRGNNNGGLDTNNDDCHDMPLPPPPPIDLHHDMDGHHNHQHQFGGIGSVSGGNHGSLPPPPPLPPLVEPDTTSSSNSSLSTAPATNTNTSSMSAKGGSQSVGRSFLDDINKGRFVLKPTQKENFEERQKKTNSVPVGEENGRDTIQPFVNNSDVAAIIDFVRKFRPHVCDSSEDEENSDWDE